MAKETVTSAATKLYEILKGLTSEERHRVVDATFMLLGETRGKDSTRSRGPEENDEAGSNAVHGGNSLPTKAKAWTMKNGLSVEQLSNYFHFDNGTVTCIELASNSTSKRSRTIDTYLLQGIAALLATGEPSFKDDEARKLCQHFGCYDAPNHSKIMKDFKNQITGTAKNGWKLTAPGLAAAAKLLTSQGGGND